MTTSSGIVRHRVLAAAIAAVALSTLAIAQDGRITMRPGDVPWPSARAAGTGTSGASGIETVVLKGDPAKAGMYVLELRAGPNLTIQAHSHRDDRVATVLKGTWYFGYGDTFNEAALKALEPGSFYTEPPDVPHFARTKEQVVLRIVGYGPSSTTYVDPVNDPTKR
jgi:quercetin dioxygenase-like cupin family protein